MEKHELSSITDSLSAPDIALHNCTRGRFTPQHRNIGRLGCHILVIPVSFWSCYMSAGVIPVCHSPPPAERRCLGMTHLSLNDPLLLAWLQQRTHRLNLLWHMRAALGSGYSSLSTMWGMFCATVVVQVAAPWFSCVFCNFDLE